MTSHETTRFPSSEAVPELWWGAEFFDPTLPSGAFSRSTWDERALAHVNEHIATEQHAIDAYQFLIEHGDAATRYLAQLIAADERRHHRVFEEIARSLQAEIDGEVTNTGVPAPSALDAARREELLAATERLLEVEHADAKALHDLQRDLRPAKDDTIWGLLTEMMQLDTEKHIRILSEIERRLRRS